MNIVLVNQNYPPHSGYGGIAVYLQTLAEQLIKMNHRVIVISGRYERSVLEFEKIKGVEVHRILVKGTNRLRRVPFIGEHMRGLSKLLYSRDVCKKILEISEKEKPDIIEFSDTEAEGFVYLNQKNRVKAIVRCHTPTFILSKYYRSDMPNNPAIISFLEKRAILLADGVTAPSRDMARQISRECKLDIKKIRVIANPVKAVTLFYPSSQRIRDRVQILHVGRFDRLKGVEVLAEAICLAVKENPLLHFVLAGNDCSDNQGSTWRKRLQKRFEDAHILANVTCLEFVTEPVLEDLYGESDIAVVPSILYESFSYTCAQSMAAGIPVIASNIGGIPETVRDGQDGILIEPGSATKLAMAILKLAQDVTLRKKMGCASREAFLEKFEARKVAQEMALFYEEVLKEI